MEHTIRNLFPTPVYYGLVKDYDNIQKEISGCIDKIDFSYNKIFGQTHHLSDPTFKENLFEKYEFKCFPEELKQHLGIYLSDLGFRLNGFTIESSWIALYRKGDYAHIHHHGGSDISGAYYFKVNKVMVSFSLLVLI